MIRSFDISFSLLWIRLYSSLFSLSGPIENERVTNEDGAYRPDVRTVENTISNWIIVIARAY